MQCSTLHYITLRTALLRYCFKKKSVSRHPLSQERCQHKQDLIYFKWSPAVQFSLAMVSLAGVPKFVVTVNSLSLKRLWRHDLHARFFLPLYPFHTPASFPSVSFRIWFLFIPHYQYSSLFTPVISPKLLKFWLGRN